MTAKGKTKDRIIAIALIAAGITTAVVDHDITFLIILAFIAVPMFFDKKQWVC